MNNQRSAFTLIELMVAIAIFMTLMAIATSFFQSMSASMSRTVRVLELHRRANSIVNYITHDVRNWQQTTAFQLKDNGTDPLSLTFMVATTDQDRVRFHSGHDRYGSTAGARLDFEAKLPRYVDYAWVRYEFDNGDFNRGDSRRSHSKKDAKTPLVHNQRWQKYVGNTSRAQTTVVDLEYMIPKGIQNNAISPTPQKEFVFFEGTGAPAAVSADGSCLAQPSERVRVYQTIDTGNFTGEESAYFHSLSAPWRVNHDYKHLYTTLEVGNTTAMSNECYAVRNPDGKSINKDKINLLGADDLDSDGNPIYPSQVRTIFEGAEYASLELIRKDGSTISSTNEDNTLGDGSASVDISGIDPVSGANTVKRPSLLRISYLLHDIEPHIIDEEDLDNDGDTDESFVQAIRDVVAATTPATRTEAINEFQKQCTKYGFMSLLVNQSIPLGL